MTNTLETQKRVSYLVGRIVDDPKIEKWLHDHAIEEMKGQNLEIPEDLSECSIYWTLSTEYLTSLTARALAEITTKI